jgi:hypothetical protein
MSKEVKESKKKGSRSRHKKATKASQITWVKVTGTVSYDIDIEIPARNHEQALKLINDAVGTASMDHPLPKDMRLDIFAKKIQGGLIQSHDVDIDDIETELDDHCSACGVIDHEWDKGEFWATCHSFETSSDVNLKYPNGAFIHEKCFTKLTKKQQRDGHFH